MRATVERYDCQYSLLKRMSIITEALIDCASIVTVDKAQLTFAKHIQIFVKSRRKSTGSSFGYFMIT